MTCKCGSDRLMEISAKHSDLFDCSIHHLNIFHDGYVPDIPNICEGDYTGFTFCLDCGLIQNFETITDETLLEQFHKDDEDDY